MKCLLLCSILQNIVSLKSSSSVSINCPIISIPSAELWKHLSCNNEIDASWSIKNLYHYYYKTSGIPITFDTLHHSILHDNLSEEDAFNLAYETWNTTPIFHYSEGKNNTRAHEHMATNLPPTYKDVYWDVELKGKDYAILEMLNKCKM